MQATEATLEDIPQLCELLGILFSQEAEFQPDTATQERGLREIFGFPERGRILVVRSGDSLLGMVSLLFTVSTALGGRVALLEDMVVREEARGGGVGSLLLEAAIESARSGGCVRITLLTDGGNESAQRFYQRHGFNESGMIPFRLSLPL